MKQLSEQEMQGFTWQMALIDCLPVLFFSITVSILSLRFDSLLFFVGAFLVIAAGALKCLWKFFIALARKDIPFLFYQMRAVMPAGFLLLLISLLVDRDKLNWSAVGASIVAFPSLIFYVLGVLGMVFMSAFAKLLDSNNPKHNWIEQGTNAVAQLCFLLGVLL